MKYYWLSYAYSVAFGYAYMDNVTTKHPFLQIKEENGDSYKYTLLNWKEITQEEYELFHQTS